MRPLQKTVLANFGFGLVGQIFCQALSFFIVVYLARILGPADYGDISLAVAVVSYFNLLATFGLPTLGIREVAKSQSSCGKMVGVVFSLRVLLGIFAYLLLVVCGAVFVSQTRLLYLLILYGLGILSASWLIDWVFVGLEDLRSPALANMLGAICVGAFTFVCVKDSSDIYYIPAIYFIGSAASCGYLLVLGRKLRTLRLFIDWQEFFALLKAAVPLALTGVLSQIYGNLDLIMLGYVADSAEVGYYSVAYKIVFVISGIVGIYSQSTLPVLIRLYAENRSGAEAFLGQNLHRTLYFMLPILVGGTVLGGEIMVTFFGEAYAPAARPFIVLLGYVFLMAVSVVLANLLLAAKADKIYLHTLALGAVANVAANLTLIPFLGASGAAAAMVVAELAICFFLLIKIKDLQTNVFLDKKFMAASFGSCLAMAMGIQGLQQLFHGHVGIMIAAGALIYLVISWPFCAKAIGRTDMG